MSRVEETRSAKRGERERWLGSAEWLRSFSISSLSLSLSLSLSRFFLFCKLHSNGRKRKKAGGFIAFHLDLQANPSHLSLFSSLLALSPPLQPLVAAYSWLIASSINEVPVIPAGSNEASLAWVNATLTDISVTEWFNWITITYLLILRWVMRPHWTLLATNRLFTSGGVERKEKNLWPNSTSSLSAGRPVHSKNHLTPLSLSFPFNTHIVNRICFHRPFSTPNSHTSSACLTHPQFARFLSLFRSCTLFFPDSLSLSLSLSLCLLLFLPVKVHKWIGSS